MIVPAASLPVIVLGSLNMDLILRVPALPRPGDTVMADSAEIQPGGKGANQAVAARRMGASVSMIGAVGEDAFGAALIKTLADEGIATAGIARVAGQPSGTASIAIDPRGENQILVAGGANRLLDASAAARTGDGPAVRIAQLESPLAAVEAFLRGGAAGTIRILNAAPYVRAAEPLLALCDILIVNEGELRAFARSEAEGAKIESIATAAQRLIASDDQVVVVTLGARGAIAVSAHTIFEIPAHPTQVVDTTGAGDCFCGTVAALLAEHQDLPGALAGGSRAAAHCVAHPAAIPAMPWRRDLISVG